jgi:drug/metabolite transporter (DMT)-like permease
MSPAKIAGILLLIAGALGLVYGGFTYTSDVHRAELGPLKMSVKEKEHVNIPVWAGLAAVLAGGLLLVLRTKS